MHDVEELLKKWGFAKPHFLREDFFCAARG